MTMTPIKFLVIAQTKSLGIKLMIMMRNSSVSMQHLLRFRFLGSLTCWKFQSDQYCKLTMSFNTWYEHLSCIIYLHYLSSCEELLTVKITDQAYASLMKLKFIMHVLRIDDDLHGYQRKTTTCFHFVRKKISWLSTCRKNNLVF